MAFGLAPLAQFPELGRAPNYFLIYGTRRLERAVAIITRGLKNDVCLIFPLMFGLDIVTQLSLN